MVVVVEVVVVVVLLVVVVVVLDVVVVVVVVVLVVVVVVVVVAMDTAFEKPLSSPSASMAVITYWAGSPPQAAALLVSVNEIVDGAPIWAMGKSLTRENGPPAKGRQYIS